MRTLYFDCFAGASGNMILGALIDAGLDLEALNTELEKLNLPDHEIKVEIVDRSGITTKHVNVWIPDEKHHRHLSDIEKIIDWSKLSESVKNRSKEIFRRLAAAEAKVHGIEVEKVHFHEVGALDAILDIVGSCVGFALLGIDHFACSRINVGSGFVEMAHGKFPVPPPAVAELLKGVPTYSNEIEGELITPTGAAIIATVCESYGSMPETSIENVGYGAGTRTYEKFPNVLRVMIGKDASVHNSVDDDLEQLVLLETNIDDASPQVVAYAMERLLEAGAKDCWITPVQMKKNRPAFVVSALCEKARQPALLDILYSETSTIGVRISTVDRHALKREIRTVETKFGPIRVKVSIHKGHITNAMPEYDDVRAAALKNSLAFSEVQNAAVKALDLVASAAAK
jgi:uncharacterized protein (TIGR00299 family) protein